MALARFTSESSNTAHSLAHLRETHAHLEIALGWAGVELHQFERSARAMQIHYLAIVFLLPPDPKRPIDFNCPIPISARLFFQEKPFGVRPIGAKDAGRSGRLVWYLFSKVVQAVGPSPKSLDEWKVRRCPFLIPEEHLCYAPRPTSFIERDPEVLVNSRALWNSLARLKSEHIAPDTALNHIGFVFLRALTLNLALGSPVITRCESRKFRWTVRASMVLSTNSIVSKIAARPH